jgi:nicotinamidase/pyrazinamidase
MNTRASRIFWDVDTQIDFLVSDGRLYVPGAESIVPNLARLTALAREHDIPLISSACAHRPGDPEFEIYGPHCLIGTRGQQKTSETLLPHRVTVPYHEVTLPDLSPHQQLIIEKEQLDVFTNPNTDEVLRQFQPALEVVLYGVVTEICVANAASGLLDRGHRIVLVEDAVRALDTEKSRQFIERAQRRGARLARTDDIVQSMTAKKIGP